MINRSVEYSWPPKNYSQVERVAPHFLGSPARERLAAGALYYLVMRHFSEGKISHWFDWEMRQKPDHFQGLTLPAGLNAFDTTHVLSRIRMSLGGWQSMATMAVDNNLVDRVKAYKDGFHYAWLDPSHKDMVSENIVGDQIGVGRIILRGAFRLLRGPNPVTVYGISASNGDEVPLRVIELCDRRRDSLFQTLPIL